MNNYLLILLLSNFSKILVKIIKIRLITFLGENKLLTKNRFTPGINTIESGLYTSSMSQFMYYELNNNSNKVITVFLDLSKGFDVCKLCNCITIIIQF